MVHVAFVILLVPTSRLEGERENLCGKSLVKLPHSVGIELSAAKLQSQCGKADARRRHYHLSETNHFRKRLMKQM